MFFDFFDIRVVERNSPLLYIANPDEKAAHETHIEMLFIAETMLSYAKWELNRDGAFSLTHSEMV